MRRTFLAVAALFLLAFPAAAKQNSAKTSGSDKPPAFVFLDPSVPVFSDFAVGGFLTNQYGLGEWGKFALTTLGLGLDLEYTLPIKFPKNMRLGISQHVDYAHIFPKKGSNLKRGDDVSFSIGAFYRMPFSLFGQPFAFQPEISYAIYLHNVDGQNLSKASGWYSDQALVFAPALRWMPSKISKLPEWARNSFEIEFSPVYTISIEHDHTLNQLGFRLGAVWHIKGAAGAKSDAKSDAKNDEALAESQAEKARLEKALDEERKEKERLQKELEESRAEQERAKKLEEERRAKELEEQERVKKLEEEERRAKELEEQERAEAKKAQLKESFEAVRKSPELLLGVDKSELTGFSPDGDGLNDTVTFRPATSYMSAAPESWSLVIYDPSGNPFKTWSGKNEFAPKEIVWDGIGDKGDAVFSESAYKAVLNVVPCAADRELLGMDEMSAKVEGGVEINSGIVLQKTGENEWRVAMTKFRFDPNEATFKQLNAEQKKDLDDTISHLVDKFKKIPGAKITVEGYANNLSGTKEENENELIPLSEKRAQAIMELIAERGFARESLDAKGMGDANPIASREDRANWWKNRRIEFLIKK